MTYSRLHEAMNGKRGISPKVAVSISTKLGLSPRDQDLFVADVEALHSRSSLTRSKALSKIKGMALISAKKAIALDSFEAISHWYHLAIVELTRLSDFQSNMAWIAERLGISPVEAKTAVDRLLRMGMLEHEGGSLKAVEDFVFTPSDTASAAIKRYQSQMITSAQDALTFQAVDERDITSVIMAVDASDIGEAKALLKEFRRKFSDRLESAPTKNAIYSLNLQYFRIDKNPKPKKGSL